MNKIWNEISGKKKKIVWKIKLSHLNRGLPSSKCKRIYYQNTQRNK